MKTQKSTPNIRARTRNLFVVIKIMELFSGKRCAQQDYSWDNKFPKHAKSTIVHG